MFNQYALRYIIELMPLYLFLVNTTIPSVSCMLSNYEVANMKMVFRVKYGKK